MGRGRPPKSTTVAKTVDIPSVTQTTLECECINCKCSDENEFYSSNSKFFSGIGKIPYCKKCIDDF